MSSQLSGQRFTPSLSLDDSPGRRRCCQRARGRVDGLFADQVGDDPEKLALIQRLYANPANSIDDIRRTLRASRTKLYRHVRSENRKAREPIVYQPSSPLGTQQFSSGTLAAWRWRRLSRSAAASLVQLVVR
jgi:hypothetical protein